jgi:hypothetical protein
MYWEERKNNHIYYTFAINFIVGAYLRDIWLQTGNKQMKYCSVNLKYQNTGGFSYAYTSPIQLLSTTDRFFVFNVTK